MSASQPILTPSAQAEFLAKQARAFLADRAIEQAAREQVPLSDIEKRMLTFSETIDAEPDYAASAAFDEQCNEEEYEAKVAGLLKRAYARDKENSNLGLWKAALRALRDQDCYILVMVNQARLGSADSKLRGQRDFAIVFAFLCIGAIGGYVVLVQGKSEWAALWAFALLILGLWELERILDRGAW